MLKFLNLKNWKTTLLGIVSTIMFVLITFGIITAEEASMINNVVNEIIGNVGSFWPTLGWILYGASSIILLFAGDPPASDDDGASGSMPTPGSSSRQPNLGIR